MRDWFWTNRSLLSVVLYMLLRRHHQHICSQNNLCRNIKTSEEMGQYLYICTFTVRSRYFVEVIIIVLIHPIIENFINYFSTISITFSRPLTQRFTGSMVGLAWFYNLNLKISRDIFIWRYKEFFTQNHKDITTLVQTFAKMKMKIH